MPGFDYIGRFLSEYFPRAHQFLRFPRMIIRAAEALEAMRQGANQFIEGVAILWEEGGRVIRTIQALTRAGE